MKRIYSLLLVAICIFSFSSQLSAQTLAFPTAEGFGAYAVGGRGGKVVEVTNLLDDAVSPPEGSFRWALQQHPGEPITVVFKVSGVIELSPYISKAQKGDLRCKRDNFTIAGQTAPGDGICIKGNKVNFGGSTNFIIRHVRFRIGLMLDGEGNVHADGNGSIGIENASNFIIDHCTFGWSGEENMTVYDNHYSTVQWSIVHEGLYASGHNKGARSYASQWGGSPATYHHNLIAHNVSRTPRINGASNISGDRNVLLDYVNNVNYNWGGGLGCYGGEREVNGATHECNFVNNYYKQGPATSNSWTSFVRIERNRTGKTSVGPSYWFIDGNKMVDATGSTIANVTNDNWAGVNNNSGYTIDELKVSTAFNIEDKYKVKSTESADNAFLSVLDGVGAFPRDAVDVRIVDETRNGTASGKGTKPTFMKNGVEETNPFFDVAKGIIDEPDAVGGYPVYNSTVAPVDSDGDGMPDAWEIENGLDPNDASDGNKVTKSGYTALEVYLNGLVGEEIPLDFYPQSVEEDSYKSNVNVSLVGDVLTLSSDVSLNNLKIYNSIGSRLYSTLNPQSTINMSKYSKGTYIIVVISEDARRHTFKVIK